jgi:hypothetical protein
MAKDHITLLRKLSEIGKEVSTIAKSGHNEKQNYDYAKEADFKRECRKPFFDRGLVLTPEILSRNNYDVTTGSGTVMHYSDVIVKYTVSDSETGESLAGTSVGSGFDAGDKAIYKAMAGAMKYWLAMTFLIPTGDDPEDDGEKNSHAQTTAQKPTTAPGAAQAPAKQDTTQSASHTNSKPNWSAFWPHMGELGLNDAKGKEYIALQASLLFKVNGIVEKLTDVVKTQADLSALSKSVVDAVFVRDNSERLPGEEG